jgi:hypothetical protein
MMPLAMDTEEFNAARNENRLGSYRNDGHLNYFLCVFGDHVSQREGYKGLDGIEAIHFYLIHKFGWLPRDVKSMSLEDIRFVMSQEMDEWNAPEEAMKISRKYSLD